MADKNPSLDEASLVSEVIRSRRSVKPRLFNGERIPDATIWAVFLGYTDRSLPRSKRADVRDCVRWVSE